MGWLNAIAGLCLAALVGVGPARAQEYTLNISHVLDPSHPIHIGALKMAEVAAARSNGRIKMSIFPASQLGADREVIQNVQSGAIHGLIEATTKFVTFAPVYAALDLPYLVKTPDEAYALLDGPVVGNEINPKVAQAGFHPVSYWEVSFRDIYTTRQPITALSDLKGLKFRVIGSPSFIALFRALGANPTPMPFGELYGALQQGVVDGAENDLLTYATSRHAEVAKHVALTHHMMLVNALFISESIWKTYPPDVQAIIAEAAIEGRKTMRAARAAAEVKLMDQLKAQGVTFTEPDLAPFAIAGRAIYPEFEEKIGKPLLDRLTGK
jgi:tripartite ATP-independent transporter DctP family solute receptor